MQRLHFVVDEIALGHRVVVVEGVAALGLGIVVADEVKQIE